MGVRLSVAASPKATLDAAELHIVRLLAHLSERVSAAAEDPSEWRHRVQASTGGTLGFQPSHDTPLTEHERAECSALECDDVQCDALAARLGAQMDALFDSDLAAFVRACLIDPQRHLGLPIERELARAIGELWLAWKTELDADRDLRRDFLTGLVATAVEMNRASFEAQTRVGPKTVRLLAKALFVGLAVVVALQAGGAELVPSNRVRGANLEVDGGRDCCHLLASQFVSDAAGRHGTRVDLAVLDFASEEPGLTILGNVEVPARQIAGLAGGLTVPFSVDDNDREALQTSYTATPVITAESGLAHALGGGVDAVRVFLGGLFQDLAQGELGSLQAAVSSAGREEVGIG